VYQVRIHGRGGQGVVTASELLSVAAFLEGRFSLAFPSFGSERTGAPVAAFCRIDDHPIRTREPVSAPDCVIVQDSTLLGHVDVFAGLRPDGQVLVNATAPVELPVAVGSVAATVVPATALAMAHLGRPVPNAALLGGFAALTGMVELDSVLAAIRERFPARLADGNVAAARAAHDAVLSRKEHSRA
jgi:pyruvate ferredoxin oxidoreductase gamma subunit